MSGEDRFFHKRMASDGSRTYFHECIAYPKCLRSSNLHIDSLNAIRTVASESIPAYPSRQDWMTFVDMYPSLAKPTAALIDERKIQFRGNTPDGNIYLAEGKYKVVPDYYTCECPDFKKLCTDDKEITCPHVLACLMVDVYKLLDAPTPRPHQQRHLPSSSAMRK